MPKKKQVHRKVPNQHFSRALPLHIRTLPEKSIPTTILVQVPAPGQKTCYWEARPESGRHTRPDVGLKGKGVSDGWVGDMLLPLSVAGQLNLVYMHTVRIPQLAITDESYYHETNPDMHEKVLQPCIEEFVLDHRPPERKHLVIPSCYYLDYRRLLRLARFLGQVPGLTFSVAANNCVNTLVQANWQYDMQHGNIRQPWKSICPHTR